MQDSVMSKSRPFGLAVFLLMVTPALGSVPLPTFGDFSVPNTAGIEAHAVHLSSKEAKRYRTVLRREAHEPANFAGHYRMVNLGCGASCAYPAVIDLKTGNVVIPGFHTVAAGGSWDPLEFRPDSRLLIVNGDLGETGKEVGTHYYEWDGQRLHLLQFVAHK
jgi:hypothetical protein